MSRNPNDFKIANRSFNMTSVNGGFSTSSEAFKNTHKN